MSLTARCKLPNNNAQYRACSSERLSRPVDALRTRRLSGDFDSDKLSFR